MDTKRTEILATCEQILKSIENKSLDGNGILLLCMKIARLSNDDRACKWLSYEMNGYPVTKSGHIEKEAWMIGAEHGRKYTKNGEDLVFTELIVEIESEIVSINCSLKNYSTNGLKFDNVPYRTAMSILNNIHNSNSEYIVASKQLSRKQAILFNQYYDYALSKYIEINFENLNKEIFEKYQDRVNKYFLNIDIDIYSQMKTINNAIELGNSEAFSQAITTCRRLFNSFSKKLFNDVLPNFTDKCFKTKSGKEINVTGENVKNKLSAVIETMSSKSAKKSIVGSNIIYLIDYIDSLSSLQSDGVHNIVDLNTAQGCIIQTYIALGQVLEMYDEYLK